MNQWSGSFRLKLLGTAIVIALGDWLLFQRGEYLGPFGLIGLAIAAALGLTRPAVRRDRRALLALGLAGVAAAAMVWDAHPLPFALFWVMIGLATLLPATARFDDGWRWTQRLLVHGVRALIGPALDALRLARAARRRSGARRGLRHGLRTLAVPLAGSALFLALFALANPLIAQALATLSITAPDERLVSRLMLWGVLGLITWGVLRPRPPRRLLPSSPTGAAATLPGFSPASVTVSLILFNLLFLAQNLLDALFLWGGAPLPGAMTLADYAHRGAYPLVATALLAALFVLVALRPGSPTAMHRPVRPLVLLWIAQNLVLVASAALRTWDYVEAYDLTRFRLAALLWMGLVAAGLVLLVVRIVQARSAAWLINANLLTTGIVLFALCFVDLGTIAARWNLAHAREIDGTGAPLDWCYLGELGQTALVPLARFEANQPQGPLATRAASLRWQIQQRLIGEREDGGWTLRGRVQLAAAAAALGPRFDQPQPTRPSCLLHGD